jgi:hypothetical protein
MSNKMKFRLYYGDLFVLNTEYGVDLSKFKWTEKGIDRPLEKGLGSIYKWLHRGFNVDPDTHVLTVQTLCQWGVEGQFWELMAITNTKEWKFYLNAAILRGWPLAMLVQWYEKGGVTASRVEEEAGPSAAGEGEQAEEEQVNAERNDSATEPQGVADEGERIPEIVQQMQNEDQEAEAVEECSDSSDEDVDPVPADWRVRGFGNPVVQDTRVQEWDYRANEVVQRAKYATIDAVKEAVKQWSISLRKEFRVVKSGSNDYEVKCVNDQCPWRLHAHKGKWKTHWVCSIVTEHTCLLEGVEKSHHNLTSDLVAKEMYGLIVDNPDYEPKMIIRQIERKYNYTISYTKAWRAKQKAFEMKFGTFEASYDNLPRMLPNIMDRNPESFFTFSNIPSFTGAPSILQRIFFCLAACVRAE